MSCIQQNDIARAEFFLDSVRDEPDARVAYFNGLIAQSRHRKDDAVRYFGRAAELDNFNQELTSDCIFKLIGFGALDLAEKLNLRSAEKTPGYFGHHFCAGMIHLHRNALELALAEFRTTATLNPGLSQIHILAGQTLRLLGRLGESEDAFLRALAISPNDAGLHENLAALFIDCKEYQAAYEHAKKAVSLNAQSPMAWALVSSTARELKLPDEAMSAAEHACRLSPEDPECRRSRGTMLKELGNLRAAALDFDFATSRRFAESPDGFSNMKEHRFLSRAKLEHDIEQLDYLHANHKDERFFSLGNLYRSVLKDLPESARTDILPVPHDVPAPFNQAYNRLLNLQPTGFSGTALSASLDTEAVENDYFNREPGITWIDDLLSDEALAALRRYCLESTLWFDFNHSNGYLGAVFESGFTDPLLLQICDELKLRFPRIFGRYPLMQMWAFKYDSQLQGIQLHGDVAAVNLNFWITPDEANLDPTSGGLRIWNKAAPADWRFKDFNSGDENAQSRIHEFLSANEASEIVVPYRQNRAVVFNSDLFHATDHFHFKEGYENRRLNITMLFGLRNSSIPTPK